MKIAILEIAHGQYALTESRLFSDCEKFFITTAATKKEMEDFDPDLAVGNYLMINTVEQSENEIIDLIKEKSIDLLFINPIFNSYRSVNNIVKKVTCCKIITTHNLNTWFYGRFWSPRSFMDRIFMRSIIKNCDYIAVEDFIYNHLKSTNDVLFKKHKFIYIPYTIFYENGAKKYTKEDSRLKIVLTGSIDGDRRRYEDVLSVIEFLGPRGKEIKFSFAGMGVGEYGRNVVRKLDELNARYPGIASYFNESSTVEQFRKEMETSDLVLSVSNEIYKGMGTVEYIGKTKPTAAIHDMMTYELPGLLPRHLKVPPNLQGSVFNYNSTENLKEILLNLLDDPGQLREWKEKAKQNSRNFTANKIRKGLPF